MHLLLFSAAVQTSGRSHIPQQSKCNGSIFQMQVSTDTNIIMKLRLSFQKNNTEENA